MRSEFRADIDCPWCLQDTLRQLRDVDGVREARASSVGHCLVVEHDALLPLDRILDDLRVHLHATSVTGNEITMTDAGLTPSIGHCDQTKESDHG